MVFVTARPERAREARDAALGVVAKPFDPLAWSAPWTSPRQGRPGARPAPTGLELFG